MSDGTYVACKISANSRKVIHEWVLANGVPNPVPPEKYHVTILFSRQELKKEDEVNRKLTGFKEMMVLPDGISLFDKKSGSESKVVVLKLRAPQLKIMHDVLRSKGGTHDFPTYEPHITIGEGVYDPAEVPFFPIVLTEIYTEPLDLS